MEFYLIFFLKKKKCKEYYLKALSIRKGFSELNEKCINLKKKSFDLMRLIENDKKKNFDLKLEEEKKIMPKIKRTDSLSSVSSGTTSTDAAVLQNTIKIVKLKSRAQSVIIPKTTTNHNGHVDTDSEIGSWSHISSDEIPKSF
jgi:hypothetical protein